MNNISNFGSFCRYRSTDYAIHKKQKRGNKTTPKYKHNAFWYLQKYPELQIKIKTI